MKGGKGGKGGMGGWAGWAGWAGRAERAGGAEGRRMVVGEGPAHVRLRREVGGSQGGRAHAGRSGWRMAGVWEREGMGALKQPTC